MERVFEMTCHYRALSPITARKCETKKKLLLIGDILRHKMKNLFEAMGITRRALQINIECSSIFYPC